MNMPFLCPCLRDKPYLDCCGKEVNSEDTYVHYLSMLNQNTIDYYGAWHEHREVIKKLISESLSQLKKRNKCIVLGAGNCNDIPLEYLGKNFQQIHLVDLDSSAMLHAISKITAEQKEKFLTFCTDLTGLNKVDVFKSLVQNARLGDYKEFLFSLRKLRNELMNLPLPKFDHNYDLIISICVTSQLFSPFIFSIMPYSTKEVSKKITFITRDISNILTNRYLDFLYELALPDKCVVFATDIFEWNIENNKINEFEKIIGNPYNLDTSKINNLAATKPHLINMGSLSVNISKLFNWLYGIDWIWDFKQDKKYIVRGLVLYPKNE